jgi:two-component system, cell cycle response regulator
MIALALRFSWYRREDRMWLRAHLESSHFPRRVLIVEPSACECSRLCYILADAEMEVYPAGDLITAVSAVASFEPDLILAQLRLPTHSGFALVRRMKEDEATRMLPVILYSDLTTAAERIRALDLGALDIITEPIVSDELIARVRAALKARHILAILERQSQRDHLTELANRSVLEDHLVRAWNAYQNRGVALAVIVADLDHFKAINDTYGHAAGDEVLRVAAKLLAGSVRSSDLVARYGGEEFVVVASDCPSAVALALAERFRSRLAEHKILARGNDITVTTSAGIAVADRSRQTSAADLFRQADEALYRAKSSGRNAVWFHESLKIQPPAAGALAAYLRTVGP